MGATGSLQVNEFGKQANSKLTEETIKKLEQAFAIGCDVKSARSYAGISKQSYYNYVKEFPELKEKFDQLRDKPVLKAYNSVFQDLDKIETAKWYLERKRKSTFSPRQDIKQETQHEFKNDLRVLIGDEDIFIRDNDKHKNENIGNLSTACESAISSQISGQIQGCSGGQKIWENNNGDRGSLGISANNSEQPFVVCSANVSAG